MAVKLNIPLPSKGLVVDRPAEFIDTRSASSLQNMEFNRNIIRKRIGTTALGSALGEAVLRYFELQVGSLNRLFRVGPTKVEVLNKALGTWSSVASSAMTGSASDPVSFAFPLLSAVKVAVYTNGIDAIRKCSITGNDAALGGTPPKCKFVRAFGPYLALGNITDDGGDAFPARLQWCDTGDPESWTPSGSSNAGSADLLDDPEDITGLGLFGGALTIHKPRSIYTAQLVTTSDVFRFDRKTTGAGAVTEAVICNLPSGEQIFLGSDGLHLFNGITAPIIDSPVQDELREQLNPAYFNRCQAIFVEELDEYWVAVPMGSDTVPQTVYRYNYRTRQMYKDVRANLTALGTYINAADLSWDEAVGTWDASPDRWDANALLSANPVVIFGDSSGNSTRRNSSTNNDNGTAVESILETKDFTSQDFGVKDFDSMMRWLGMGVWAKGNSISVYYSTDDGVTWTLGTNLTLTSSYPDDAESISVWLDRVTSKIRFRFINNTAGETFTLKKYQVNASPREARG